ncbi:MAG: hypothetical protein HY814_14815 [Candidatus Riflebacteria bacterium]|nr:hypothetical protein [Candidatus Riflebacteria bacterium]
MTLTTRLVYPVNSGGVGQVMRGDIDGGAFQALDEIAGEMQGVAMLPTSKIIVYSLKRGSSHDLRTFDYATNARQDLTTDSAQDLNPVWASDKCDSVVFQSDRDNPGGAPSLYLMQLSDKKITRLVEKPGDDPSPGVDLRGRRTVYFAMRQGEQSSIQSLTLPGGQPMEVVSGRGNVMRPSPSPSGIHLAYLVQEATGASLEVIEIKTKKLVFRKDGASPRGWIAWSPEGDKLAYQVEDRSQARIVLVHPVSGRSVVHPNFLMALGRFAWVK